MRRNKQGGIVNTPNFTADRQRVSQKWVVQQRRHTSTSYAVRVLYDHPPVLKLRSRISDSRWIQKEQTTCCNGQVSSTEYISAHLVEQQRQYCGEGHPHLSGRNQYVFHPSRDSDSTRNDSFGRTDAVKSEEGRFALAHGQGLGHEEGACYV